MNKRTDRIRSLFAQQPAPMLSADNAPGEPTRAASGSVRAIKDSFSAIERENEDLRQRLSGAGTVVEIDPVLIDPSPVADRFAAPDDPSLAALKQSIEDRGQEVPVLLRRHPHAPDRFQTAYGHRRVHVLRELGRSVKAVVRELTDEELVVAQGVENSAREDLTFIERATFALKLEEGGYARTVVQQALAVDRAEASKLIAVARSIPMDIIHSIGRAPRIGRGRWQELASLIGGEDTADRARARLAELPRFAGDSDERFLAMMRALKQGPLPAAQSSVDVIRDHHGRPFAEVQRTARQSRVIIDQTARGDFASYLVERLPELFDAFTASRKP